MNVDERDRQLIELLRVDCRQSIADLARALNVSRSTVKERMERLEKRGVVKGYSLVLSDEYARGRVSAYVMIGLESGKSHVIAQLKNITQIRKAYAVSGNYDLTVLVEADSVEALDTVLDRIRALEGIASTLTSVILSTKFER